VSAGNSIDKAVSAIPIFVSVLMLFVGGTLGTWFLVEENVYYFAYDSSSSGFLDGKANYDHFLNKVSVSDTTGDYDISYDERNCNCDNRDGVFFNIKLLMYVISFTSFVGLGILFARESAFVKKLALDHPVKTLISPMGRFAMHVSTIILILVLAGYIAFGIPGAIQADYEGTLKECLYDSNMTIVGKSDCFVLTDNDQAELHSTWSLGLAPFLLIIGLLIPSIFSASSAFDELSPGDKISGAAIPSEPEYFFDPDAQILFNINTGEIVASFIGEEREFFYDEDAMVLFDEESGEILFSAPSD
tara:strand:+ start:2892 stop:3800 length:909 start_codon:yes stop_codon:yes gene_type:complete